METLTRLVSESLARHGFDRPVDYRRLQWSRWFRCESHHSLLIVPSKPGVFALAEEVVNLASTSHPAEPDPSHDNVEERRFSAASGAKDSAASAALSPEVKGQNSEPRRMLAVTQFFEDDDMAFVLDRMLSQQNPMRARMASGRYFVRFVEIHDQAQRRSICAALNQWIVSSAEKATGIGSHFDTSLEVTPEPPDTSRSYPPDSDDRLANQKENDPPTPTTRPRLNSAVATTIHCSSSFPSGF
jgi:hypothetical protein